MDFCLNQIKYADDMLINNTKNKSMNLMNKLNIVTKTYNFTINSEKKLKL